MRGHYTESIQILDTDDPDLWHVSLFKFNSVPMEDPQDDYIIWRPYTVPTKRVEQVICAARSVGMLVFDMRVTHYVIEVGLEHP